MVPKHFYRSVPIVLMAFLLMISSCGRIDNLDADDFDFFSDEDKKSAELRRYADPAMSSHPVFEYFVNPKNALSVDYERHLRKVCDYSKLPYRSRDINNFDPETIDPATRVISMCETKLLDQRGIDFLVKFVAEGGTLFLPFAGDDHRIGFLLGIKPDAEYATDTQSKGTYFKTPFLPNMKGKTAGDDAVHYGFTAENFSNTIRVHAVAASNPAYPVIIENPIGKGRVMFFNSTAGYEKVDRGLMFSAILKGLEGIPYPIANTATIFLDDFPSPLYETKLEPIASEMNLSIADFVRKVWWPDLVELAERFNMKYSAMIAFDYKNKIHPPYMFDQWDAVKVRSGRKTESVSDYMVRDVAKRGHELAFHGYNHVSLTKELWPQQEHIGPSLKAVQKKWEISKYGPLPATYVPPSNIIDKYGVNELKKGLPSLKYMCSLYLGDIEHGGGREFDFDPYNKDFFDYPRITSGFYFNDKKKYSQESLFLFTGIWTHFVHPDDVFQIDNPFNISKGNYELRNGRNLGWRKTKGKDESLLSEFTDYIEHMAQSFPQMRFLDAGESGAIVNDWRASRFRHTCEDGSYTVEELNPQQSITNKQYWFVYGSFENASRIEAQLSREGAVFNKTPYLDGFLYMAFTKKPKLTLKDLQYKNKLQPELLTKVSRKVQNDYRRYVGNVQRYLKSGFVSAVDEEKMMLEELAALKTKMLSETKIDTATWNKYARFMSWEDRGHEVWKMLEEYCVKYPHRDNIMYSKVLAEIVYYPNELTREKWMSAQMLVTPNDRDLLNSYVADFYTPENQEKIRQALVNLLKVDTSFDTYIKYLQHLLTYDQPEALKELADKQPTSEFAVVATEVAWLYANEKQFEKAYEWSKLSDEIDFSSQVYWLVELKAYKLLESEYKKYIKQHPEDFRIKAMMAGIYHEQGRFREAWVLADSLPEVPEKDELRRMLNMDVIWVDVALQQDLLDNYPGLFYPEVKDKLTKDYRIQFGRYIAFDSEAGTNRTDPQSWKNVLSYNWFDKKKNLHSVAATYSTMYRLKFPIKDLDNVTHAIGGIQYKFTSPKVDEKIQYWSRGRIEYSDYQKFYYQFGIGAHLSKPKAFRSAQLQIFPAETGPAHSKSIYRMQLNIYQDYYFLKYFNGSISLEGNYYTKSKEHSTITIEDSYEGSITAKLGWDTPEEKKMKFIPFIEGSLAQASIGSSIVNTSGGYPYWMIDSRLYGGGGLGWKYGKFQDGLRATVEAAYFFDDYSDSFQRFTGSLEYQLFDFTAITAGVEIYAQSKFYSNNLQLGVKYNLKEKKRKKK